MDHVDQPGPLRAKRPAIGRVIDIPFDVEDVSFLAFGQIAPGIHDHAAGDRAVGTGVPDLCRMGELERPYHCCIGGFGVFKPERCQCSSGHANACALQEFAP